MVSVCKCLTRIFGACQFGTLASKIRPLRDIFRVFHVALQAHFGDVARLRDINRCLHVFTDSSGGEFAGLENVGETMNEEADLFRFLAQPRQFGLPRFTHELQAFAA